MNERVVQLERLVELGRGLARDDFALTQMCKRMFGYVRELVDPALFHVAIASDDGTLFPEYHVSGGEEQHTDSVPNAEDLCAFPLRHADRKYGVVLVRADPGALEAAARDLEIAMDFFTLAVASVHRVRATERRIDRDDLTNLYNRNYGMRRLQEELSRASAAHSGVCALIVDIDGVEDLNTRFGHQTGDSAIRTVSDALRSICRHSDVLCRFGGDRFLIVYPGFSGDPGPVARRVRTQVEMRVLPVPGGAIGLKASIGAAVSNGGTDGHALVRESERALLRDKNERRRRIEPKP